MNDDELARQRVIKKLGVAYYKYLQKQNPPSRQLQGANAALDIWRENAAPARADEKF